MSIVFITIPGSQKIEFGNLLHKQTQNGVDYVIVQKSKRTTIRKTLSNIAKTVGWLYVPRELMYALLLRLSKKAKHYLQYFRTRDKKEKGLRHIPKVLEVDSVNSDEVYTLLQKLKPRLLVVWGTAVIEPRIFKIAKRAINLHLGLGEYYRGAVANHFAVLNDELDKLGATIHYINEKVDTGDMLATLYADTTLPPKECFQDLNNRAEHELLRIALELWKGKDVESIPQEKKGGRNVLLREWTPSRRWAVAKKLEQWEKEVKMK
jgi:folate-dependent phosphoribosylglycinamide formyltransferase PurN